ncbi:unnamed protein product [Rhizophagus irregularis]|nr:unnamed protein product [Rhizophagus irregularis]CAB5374109.1 unnamed protein product [Rhizophagus irregularis]
MFCLVKTNRFTILLAESRNFCRIAATVNSTSSNLVWTKFFQILSCKMCKIRFLLSPRNVCRIAATVTQLLQLSLDQILPNIYYAQCAR